jgi:hypothetical protein
MRWMIPHEHGAYGQLGFPLAAVLAAGHPGAAAALLVLAFAAAFVTYEPLLVLLGQRGARARREHSEEAKRTLAWSAAIAVGAGSAGAWLLQSGARWTLAVPAVLGAVSLALVAGRIHKTTTGEMFLAVGLSCCAVPVGVAAGLRPSAAVLCAVVFASGFSAATLAVRSAIARQRREPAAGFRIWAVALALASLAAVELMSRTYRLHPALWTAAIPLSVLTAALAVRPPSARHLRRVGWTLVGASAAATVLLAVFLRGYLQLR